MPKLSFPWKGVGMGSSLTCLGKFIQCYKVLNADVAYLNAHFARPDSADHDKVHTGNCQIRMAMGLPV